MALFGIILPIAIPFWTPYFEETNFGGLILGCIDASDSDSKRNFREFLGSTKFVLVCTFFIRDGKTLENPPQGPAKCSCICGQGCRTKPGLQRSELRFQPEVTNMFLFFSFQLNSSFATTKKTIIRSRVNCIDFSQHC